MTRGVNDCKRGAIWESKCFKADATRQPAADAIIVSHEVSSFRLQQFYMLHATVDAIGLEHSLQSNLRCISLHCAAQHNLLLEAGYQALQSLDPICQRTGLQRY